MPWFYANAGQQLGPIADADFEQLVQRGAIQPATLVWRAGMADWQPYSTISGAAALSCDLCKQTFPADGVIHLGETTVCAACKPLYLQRAREGLTLPDAPHWRWAGFWIRGLASFIDLLLLEAVSIGTHMAMGYTFLQSLGVADFDWDTRAWILLGVDLFIDTAYQTVLVARFGGTVGKLICRVRVMTPGGSRLTYMHSFARALAKWVSVIPCGIGFVLAAFDSQKRTLHDRICGTRVVRI
jgi:uncharacterized RDD family membrane protein YckC